MLATLLVATFALSSDPGKSVRIRRFDQNPIIRADMLPGTDGANINGPSLIRVPDWLPGRLGNYYLYFAHHEGTYIRLAYADRLEGPWKIYQPGTLQLDQASGCHGHIASPDVHVDEATHEIRMYFHGPARAVNDQKSFVAVSKDGIHFVASDEILGNFYFRVFFWNQYWYAMSKGGKLFRSKDGLTHFEEGPNPFPKSGDRGKDENKPGCRHVAVQVVGHMLHVYYSNIGDEPESILRRDIDLSGDWKTWRTSPPQEILRPDVPYEGAALPRGPSSFGRSRSKENSVRDPYLFVDTDGQTYLLYSVAGESGIAIAEIAG